MKIYKIIIAGLILGLILAFSFYLSGIIGVLKFILSLIIYSLLFYSISFLWKKLRKKEVSNFYVFLQNFLFSISIFFSILIAITFGTTYYFNEVNPASMNEYTISNGKKVVKFQAMIHIGKNSFYEEVKENIKNFKEKGAVYFYEGVKPGSKESSEKFDKALGVKFDRELYKNFSKLYGVDFQDNSKFLGLVNDKDFNVDISLDDIIKLYEEKDISEKENKTPLDANKEILNTLSSLNQRELKVLVYINQSLLNAMIGNETILKGMENFQNKELFDVILDERNKVVVKEIINSDYEKIFITYGKLHFDGILKLLKENDKNWKIIEEKKLFPIGK